MRDFLRDFRQQHPFLFGVAVFALIFKYWPIAVLALVYFALDGDAKRHG
jgi:hypothetical protein